MTILFDFELIEGYEFSEKGHTIIKRLRDFVAQRLKPLEEEIVHEGGRIVIYLFTNPMSIKYEKFSEELLEKINASLTTDDFKFIQSFIMKDF